MAGVNPASIPLLEIVNTSGKSGVGIFATTLKAYAGMFTAVKSGIESGSNFIQFKDESIGMFKGKSKSEELYNSLHPKAEKELHLYKGKNRKYKNAKSKYKWVYFHKFILLMFLQLFHLLN